MRSARKYTSTKTISATCAEVTPPVWARASNTKLAPSASVLFLLQAQIIETYWHLEAELCMVSEEDKPESYRAQFRGVHRYCTNSCEEDAFAFTVHINKKTGGLSLIGGN